MNKKFGLGKGIDALLEDYKKNTDSCFVNISMITESPYQPRKTISTESLLELSQSIKENGLIEPLVVRKVDQHYELIAGHRRLLALKSLLIDSAPVFIITASDKQAAEFSIIENVQRKDLNPIELAESIAKIIHEFQLTHELIANSIGKSRVYITNILRLLNLDKLSRQSIEEEKISESHGRLLLQITDESQRVALLNEIIQKQLSVRDVENLLKKKDKKPTVVDKVTLNQYLPQLEKNFLHFFNKTIHIRKNKIELVFKDEQEVLSFIQQFQQLYKED
jgi:ParB family transcriptional regulator, chromosome partitioning protein